MANDIDRNLEIYLDDHWAGAGAGVALARRLHHHNVDSPWAAALARVASEIKADEEELATIRRALGLDDHHWKRWLAIAGERVGRLKPNGHLVRHSPLSRVVECEALLSGISAKHRLWVALSLTKAGAPELSDHDLELLIQRAEEQLAVVRGVHEWAVLEAFGPAASHRSAA